MPAANYLPEGPIGPYTNQLAKFIDLSAVIFRAFAQQGQRRWMTPDPFNGWDGNVFNLSGGTSISAAYDRTELNKRYREALLNGTSPLVAPDPVNAPGIAPYGQIAETMCAKYQVDDLAAQERAFRTRETSYVRCAAHAAGRRKAHGIGQTNGAWTGTGGVFDTMLSMTKGMIDAAVADDLTPQSNPVESSLLDALRQLSALAGIGGF